MLETALSLGLIDRLIQLASVKERNKEKYFNNFIEPLYRDAEQIARDYLVLFAELIHRLDDADGITSVVEWLEERRCTLQPLRMKVRALLKDGLAYGTETSVDKFKRGIWGLMKGGISLIEDGHGITGEYGFGDHTVLDIMKRMRTDSFHLRDFPLDRKHLIDQARRQHRAIENAWNDVVESYAELKHQQHKPR